MNERHLALELAGELDLLSRLLVAHEASIWYGLRKLAELIAKYLVMAGPPERMKP